MIYVFLVDTGTMMTFEMNLALESVAVLKNAIHRAVRVPPDKQVLLASGGMALDVDNKVCHYSAGTDTSPIFLFSKVAIEDASPPTPSVDCGTEGDLKAQVDGCLNMPATYNTVVARTQLAQQFHECARDITRTCRQLVHDQHLQQQGWAAVVANLEDIIQAFKTRFESFQHSFSDYLSARDGKVTLLKCFDEDLKLLARIPVFPELLGKTEEEKEEQEEEEEEQEVQEEEEEEEGKKKKKKKEDEEEEGRRGPPHVSLLDWISAKDSQSNVRQIAELCVRGLTQISEGLLEQLGVEVGAVLREADRPQMKEVKGLEERLCGLEQLMQDASCVVQEQCSFSQALLKNQDRAGKVNDPSIFPDLCTSHRKNLMHMLRNHQKLQDIKRRCIKAKEELSENLHARLKWIMYIERKLYEADTRVAMHQESVRRLAGLLQVVEQIHRAPRVYAAAITEVARRQAFSKGFLQWASALSSQSGEVWRREVEVRRGFFQDFSSHFLATLFPGMDDLPPDFATRLPCEFDVALPKVTEENIEQLRQLLPELANFLVVGEVVAVPPLLLHVSALQGKDERSSHGYLKKEKCHVSVSAAVTRAHAHESEKAPPPLPFPRSESVEFERMVGDEEEQRSTVKTKLPQTTELTKHIRLDPTSLSCEEEEEEEEEEEGGGGGMGGALPPPPPPHLPQPPPGLLTANQDEAILALQVELTGARGEVDRLRDRLGQLGDLKGQVTALRDKVEIEGSAYLSYVSQVSSSILDLLLQVQEENLSKRRELEEEGRRKLEDAHSQINTYMDQLTDAHRRTEVYRGQLEDAQREIEVYTEQLQRQEEGLQQAATEMEEERRREVEALEVRWRAEVSRLTLEQEVEREEARQELATLRQALEQEVEARVSESVSERLKEEKEKIVKILEAGFTEREKQSIERVREELVERLARERVQAVEATERQIRKEVEEEWKEMQRREERRRAEEREELLASVRGEGEEAAERMVREAVQEERRKHRLEVEGIRSRFRMMTTSSTSSSAAAAAATLASPTEDSPSSPSTRWEGLERLREEIVRERERELEERFSLLQEEERRRIEEDKQMEFTEELRKVTQDKERVIEDLKIRVKLLTEECERRGSGGGGGEEGRGLGGLGLMQENLELKEQVAGLQAQVSRLEGELTRAKRFSFVTQPPPSPPTTTATTTAATTTAFCDLTCMTSSTATTTTAASMTSLELRERLTHTHTQLGTHTITVSSCQQGDTVLVAWDPAHCHYRVLLEGNPHLHFLHSDSYSLLGLIRDNPQQKMYCAAEVMSKEFCQAKKDDNRFKVPRGTKFYRVLAKPWAGEGSSGTTTTTTATTTTSATPATTTARTTQPAQ